MHLGDSCMKQHDTFHALQYYEQARANHDCAEVHRRIAECYFNRADYNKCIATLKQISIFNDDSLDHEALRRCFTVISIFLKLMHNGFGRTDSCALSDGWGSRGKGGRTV